MNCSVSTYISRQLYKIVVLLICFKHFLEVPCKLSKVLQNSCDIHNLNIEWRLHCEPVSTCANSILTHDEKGVFVTFLLWTETMKCNDIIKNKNIRNTQQPLYISGILVDSIIFTFTRLQLLYINSTKRQLNRLVWLLLYHVTLQQK